MGTKKNLPYIVAMAVSASILVAVLAFSAVSSARHNATLEQQAEEIVSLKNQVEAKRSEVQAGSSSVVQQVTGIDLTRKAKDDEAIKAFAEKVCTWDSHEAYSAMRSEVLSAYSLSPSSRFASVFLPDYGSIKDGDGVEHNVIDFQKLSCAYRGMKSIVSGISGGQYSYFVIVTCAGGRDGSTSTFDVVFCCDVDGIGNISNLEAYTLT